MKGILLGTLLLTSLLHARAQQVPDVKKPIRQADNRNNIFADIGTTGDGVGASVTYNSKLFRYFGVGAGIQGYSMLTSSHNLINTYQFVPAIYGDLRGYIPARKSLFFYMVDIGVDIYKVDDPAYPYDKHTNGLYTGFGIGYCYRVTKRGAGPYASIKIVSDIYTTKNPATSAGDDGRSTNANATSAISIGFKF